MHTDEYEISMSREIALCNDVIKRISRDIGEFEERYGFCSRKVEINRSLVSEKDYNIWTEKLAERSFWTARSEDCKTVFRQLKKKNLL